MVEQTPSRLGAVMSTLGLSAVELSREVGISNSLISRWQKGVRPLPSKGNAARDVAAVLVRLDTEGSIDELIAPYNTSGNKVLALKRFLSGEDMPGIPFASKPALVQYAGEYVAQQRVLLGVKGFRKATLLMLDYLTMLPPGQELTICAHSGFELWHAQLPFALQVLQKLSGVLKRNTRVTLITRNAEGFDGSHYFSVYWLVAQLKGIIRTRYYEGEAPSEYFVASIKGYWSARIKPDSTAEDNMISTLFTDPRNILEDEAHIASFVKRSVAAGQFNFLECPGGNAQNKRVWRAGALPQQNVSDPTMETEAPSGGFSAIGRVPSFGIMSAQEWSELRSQDPPLALPRYLFCPNTGFASAPHRIILCKEDIQAGLSRPSLVNEPLTRIAGQKVSVSRRMLAAQLWRLLDAMDDNPSFEVALMPRTAFDKLELELIYWENSAALGWLQDGSESLLTIDAPTCKSFANAVEHVWEHLQKGWKRKKTVKTQLRKWLAGEGLDEHEPDSPNIRNWQVMPKDQ